MLLSRPALMWAIAVASPILPAAPPPPADGAIYVSPDGNDAWTGTRAEPNPEATDGPFKTLKKAADQIQPGQTCWIRKGVYREVLKAVRSGEPGKPITFQNYKDETVTISGADALAGWAPAEGKIQRAPMEWDLQDQNQLFLGDTMLTEARWPDNPTGALLQPERATAETGSASTLTDPRLPGGDDFWKDALLWCAGGDKWICWSEKVTAFHAKTKTLTFDKPQADPWYRVRAGSPYVLMGVRSALDTPGEWWLDRTAKQVLLIPPAGTDLKTAVVEAKRRPFCIDLSGVRHVRVAGLRFRAGGLLTDAKTSNVSISRCTGLHVGHSYLKDVAETSGVMIRGIDNEVTDCELAFSSTSVLHVDGTGHRIVNNFIHDGNYGGKWQGTVALRGRKILFSHNTVRHSGRDLVSIHGLQESLIQHNDLSDAGWITCDLGMTYGHNTDFMNTVIRRNLVHDNHAPGCAMGIYFDHCSQNAIVHHNIVWNAAFDPIRFNNPSYFDLIFNNSCYNSGPVGTFDHSRRDDLFGMRQINNLYNKDIRLPSHVTVERNLCMPDPGYVSPAKRNFALQGGSKAAKAGLPLEGVTTGSAPDLGALESGKPAWKAGHDFAKPPVPAPVWEAPNVAWMNLIRNACFELETLESWTKTGSGEADLSRGNGWGNGFGRGKIEKTGTNHRELRLSKGAAGVEQVVAGLHPRTAYTLSGWIKVSDSQESVRLGVRHPDGQETAKSAGATEWTRVVVDFTTGPSQTQVTVFAAKSDGPGAAFVDNLGLPKSPRGYTQPPAKNGT